MRVNILLNTHKKQKNLEEEGGEGTNFADIGKFTWATSNILLMFMENCIQKYTPEPHFTVSDSDVPLNWTPAAENIKLKLMTWVTFKSLIWEIYDHRIENAPEINGAINNTYLSLDEHLLVFMMEKHQNRSDTERALVEFLASLKYYIDNWQRAKVYA